MDKINDIIGNNVQLSPVLIIPVILVFVGAVVVFVLGFKKPEEPKFKKTSNTAESNQKKTKRKEKIVQNGNAIGVEKKTAIVAAPVEKTPTPVTKPVTKSTKKSTPAAAVAAPVAVKKTTVAAAKKDKKAQKAEKPVVVNDDDGEWQTVISRNDKKNKKIDETPAALGSSPAKQTSATDAAKDNKKKEKSPPKTPKQAAKPKKEQKINKIGAAAAAVAPATVVPVVEEPIFKLEDIIAAQPVTPPIPQQEPPTTVDGFETVPSVEEVFVAIKAENKKINAKVEVNPSSEEIVPLVADAIKETSSDVTHSSSSSVTDAGATGSNIAFDELGDAWTEAKAPKKSKKRARKE